MQYEVQNERKGIRGGPDMYSCGRCPEAVSLQLQCHGAQQLAGLNSVKLNGAEGLLAAGCCCSWVLRGFGITGQVQDMVDGLCLCSGCGFRALEAKQRD